MTSPQVAFDPEANAVYIQFSDNAIAETIELSESVYVDVDTEGEPVGLEVLGVSHGTFAPLSSLSHPPTLKDLLQANAA